MINHNKKIVLPTPPYPTKRALAINDLRNQEKQISSLVGMVNDQLDLSDATWLEGEVGRRHLLEVAVLQRNAVMFPRTLREAKPFPKVASILVEFVEFCYMLMSRVDSLLNQHLTLPPPPTHTSSLSSYTILPHPNPNPNPRRKKLAVHVSCPNSIAIPADLGALMKSSRTTTEALGVWQHYTIHPEFARGRTVRFYFNSKVALIATLLTPPPKYNHNHNTIILTQNTTP